MPCAECVIQAGVPEGSIFGSLLFLIYIDDTPRAIQHHQRTLMAENASGFIEGDNLRRVAGHSNKTCHPLAHESKAFASTDNSVYTSI